MMRSHVGAVAAAIGVEAITEVRAHFRGGAVHGGRYGVAGRGVRGTRLWIAGRPVARAAGAAAIGAAGRRSLWLLRWLQ